MQINFALELIMKTKIANETLN